MTATKTYGLVLLALLVLSFPLLADKNEIKTPQEQAQNKHSLWVIETGGNRVYLLGSVHVLRESDYPLPDVFYQAYADAENLVMEIDIDSVNPVDTYANTRKAAMLPPNSTLATAVGKENFTKATALAARSNINLSQFDRVEPWFAAMTITQVQLQRLGFKAEHGIEMHFTKMAKADHKPGTGLETIEEQFGFFDGLSMQAQTRLFLESLTETDEIIYEGEQMLQAWKTGDTKALERLFERDFEANPELRTALLIERNNRWLPKIISFMQEPDDYLVIVGALHLVGEHGLVQLLSKQGYTPRQL